MKIFGKELKFNGFDIWHKGNLNLDNKADKSYVDTEIGKKQNALGFTPIPDTGGTIRSGDLRMDGGSVNYVRPETTGGWARGFWWSQRDLSRIGGIGVLGSADTVSKFYIGYGLSPWTNSIFEAFPSYVNINGKLRSQETLTSDVATTVTTKKYVDERLTTKADMLHNHDTLYEPKNANVQTHIESMSNPHGTTKSHVGLGSVLNYGLATQAEAEAGTSNIKYMTPLRTKQAIDKYTPTKLSQFENDIGAGAGLNIVASPTEPSINPGDWWYKEI